MQALLFADAFCQGKEVDSRTFATAGVTFPFLAIVKDAE